MIETKRERERVIETERGIDRDRERWSDRDRERWSDRNRERWSDRDRERWSDRDRERRSDRDRERGSDRNRRVDIPVNDDAKLLDNDALGSKSTHGVSDDAERSILITP